MGGGATMELGLRGKVVLAMASSSGLGKAIAKEFALEGAKVVLCATNEAKLEAAGKEIQETTGNRVCTIRCDVTNAEDIARTVEETTRLHGTIHVLVNNAGGPPAGGFDLFDDSAWQHAFELDFLSYVRTIRAVLPFMRKQRWGRIVNSTSSSVKQVIDNLILSNSIRLSVLGLTKTLAQEVGKDGILVNVIGPGRFSTERIEYLDGVRAKRAGVSPEEIHAATCREIPLGRYGDPEEYARLAVFLCSEANTYITGQTILADGGMVKAV
jgi:3-oxoacyl-[acyl-carrier protein] reductase